MRSYVTHVSVGDSSRSPGGSSSADADTQHDAPSLAQLLEADCRNSSISLVDTSLFCGTQLHTPLKARLLEEHVALAQLLSGQVHTSTRSDTAEGEVGCTKNLDRPFLLSVLHQGTCKSHSSQSHPPPVSTPASMMCSSLPSPWASGAELRWEGGPGHPGCAGTNVGPATAQLPPRLDQGFLLQNMFFSTQEHAPRQSSSVKIEDIGPAQPASALNSPLTMLSSGEEQRLQELEAARRQLGKILQAVQDDSTAKWKPKFDEMLVQIQRLVGELGAEVEQHQQLQSRYRRVSMQLASAERELHWMQMPPLAGQASPPASAADARAAAAAVPGALVSVLQLPPASEWDASWDERVRRLQTLELLHLHRQWLQHSAMLLPKVQMLRGTPIGLEVAQQLEELYVRYDCFSQRVMRLAPEHWSEFALYSLDTMQQMQQQPHPAEVRKLLLMYAPESTKKLLPIQLHYAGVFARLQEQSTPLQRRYEQLAAGACSSRVHSSSWDMEVDETLRLLQANLLQQQLERAAFVHALNFALPVEAMLQLKLLMYPLAENGQVVTHKEYVP